MKKLLAILIVSIMFLPGISFAQEQTEAQKTQELPVQPPVIIPTIFDDKKQTACPIEEPCENTIQEPEQEQQNNKTKTKAKKIKKKKTESETKAKKSFPNIWQFFKIDWNVSTPNKKVNIEQYLNLTEEQIEAAKQNRLDGEEKMKPYLEEIKIREKKIENIEFYNTPGEARDEQVKRYYLEIRDINKEADKIREENQANFEKLLTPEQLELFREITKPAGQAAPQQEQL